MLLAILLAVDAALKPFLKIDAPAVVLEHARVIDGTGAPPREDQTLYIVEGKLAASAPAGAQRIDLRDHTVFPGLVGMHDHIFYPAGGAIFHEMARSFPRLYLAAGVTTIRTAGSIEPYTDLELKKEIDSGKQPGPRMYVTGPYIEGKGTWTPQMHQVRGPDDARRTVEFWAGQGATSFKLYSPAPRRGRPSTPRTNSGSRSPGTSARSDSPRRRSSASTIWSTASSSTRNSSPARSPTSAPRRKRSRRCRR